MSSMKGGPTPSSPGLAATTGGGINSPHVGTPVSRVVQALTPQERANYEMFFVQADADKDGVIGPSDAAWFLNLGLDKKTLSEVPPPSTCESGWQAYIPNCSGVWKG